ncbi:15371_t:CDS:2, partial [Gigaspora rosea]
RIASSGSLIVLLYLNSALNQRFNPMEDPELEAIRQARICEFQAAAAAGGGSKSSEDNGKKKRIARISIVKVEKARTVEDLLIRMA